MASLAKKLKEAVHSANTLPDRPSWKSTSKEIRDKIVSLLDELKLLTLVRVDMACYKLAWHKIGSGWILHNTQPQLFHWYNDCLFNKEFARWGVEGERARRLYREALEVEDRFGYGGTWGVDYSKRALLRWYQGGGDHLLQSYGPNALREFIRRKCLE